MFFWAIFFQQHGGFHTIRLVKPRLTLFTLVFSRFGGSSDVGFREKTQVMCLFGGHPFGILRRGTIVTIVFQAIHFQVQTFLLVSGRVVHHNDHHN